MNKINFKIKNSIVSNGTFHSFQEIGDELNCFVEGIEEKNNGIYLRVRSLQSNEILLLGYHFLVKNQEKIMNKLVKIVVSNIVPFANDKGEERKYYYFDVFEIVQDENTSDLPF